MPCFRICFSNFTRIASALTILLGTLCTGIFGPHIEVRRTPEEYYDMLVDPVSLAYYAACCAALAALGLIMWRYGIAYFHAVPAVFAGILVGNQFLFKVATELGLMPDSRDR